MVYQWKTGSRFKTDVNVAVDVMKELESEGRLNAESLVEMSRPEDAPLHSEFEWDDAIAAEEWRKQIGRNMIAAVVFKIEESQQKEPVRMFFHIENGQPNYERIEAIIENEDKTEKLFNQALGELKTFRQKYNGIKEFSTIFREISNVEALHNKPA